MSFAGSRSVAPASQETGEESPDCIEQGTGGNLRRITRKGEALVFFCRKVEETGCELTHPESNSDELWSKPQGMAKE